MKWALLFCVAAATSLPISFAVAAQGNDDDIVILAVKPRDPNLKPVAVSVSPNGQDVAKPQIARTDTQDNRH